MNINETPKRIGRGINKTYYHYMVYNSDNELNTYYRTTKEPKSLAVVVVQYIVS